MNEKQIEALLFELAEKKFIRKDIKITSRQMLFKVIQIGCVNAVKEDPISNLRLLLKLQKAIEATII